MAGWPCIPRSRPGRHGQADAAQVFLGQAFLQPGPGLATVRALVDAAAGAAVHHAPHVAAALVGGGIDHIRMAGIQHHVRDAGVGIDGKHGLPGLAAVGGLVEPPVATLLPERALGGHVDHLAVPGIHQDLGNVLAGLQPQVLPVLAAIQAAVDAVAVGHGALAVVLAGAHPHHVGVPGIDGDAANGEGGLLVEDRLPGGACVDGLPEATRGRRHEPGVRPLRIHGDVPHPARGDGGADAAQGQRGQGRALGQGLVLVAGRRGDQGSHRQEQGQERERAEPGHGAS